ncbi:hypothetical protein AA0Z99_04385 [Agrococcus sp. 1P02AA]|uniref:hypothetical protein n=1 Tax=Agrococcus sp. 1P02AA TaxID=3132259 RepID=UPI0039A5E9F1
MRSTSGAGSARSSNGRSLLLGVAGGMRSLTPLAAVVLASRSAGHDADWRRWPVLRHRSGRALVVIGAAAELVGDKLPATPSRLTPPALVGRVAAAALAGAALATSAGEARSVRRGAAIAAVGAVIGAFGGLWARSAVSEASGAPDPAIAVLEDVAAIAIARWATAG